MIVQKEITEEELIAQGKMLPKKPINKNVKTERYKG